MKVFVYYAGSHNTIIIRTTVVIGKLCLQYSSLKMQNINTKQFQQII